MLISTKRILNIITFLTVALLALIVLFYKDLLTNQLTSYKTSYSKSTRLKSQNLLFYETFEGRKPFSNAHNIETGNWDYALQYVSYPVYSGNKSARFEIRENQPLVKNGKRAEVTIIKGLPSRDMWYSFAVYFPSDGFAKDSQRDVINQWYQRGTPATSLRIRHDRIYLETGSTKENRQQFDICFVAKDVWHEFVLHFYHSHESDGLVEVWHDGEKKITHHGGNMYKNILPKWKIGIYKASFKYGTSDVTKRILFFDNIKVGSELNSYSDMLPGIDKEKY